jgi:lysophospholipase L1-like esterase
MSKPTIVFLGDSITEGKIGASYVERIRTQLQPDVRVINAGINGDTTVNMWRRIDRDVLPHQPSMVVVIAGLNDLGTAYALQPQRHYYRWLKQNWIELTPTRFAASYQRLIITLQQRTNAQIVVATPTSLTEQLDMPVQTLINAYSAIVWAVAARMHVPVIDTRAAFLRAIAEDPRPGPDYRIEVAVQDMITVGLKQASYRELTHQRGYRLLCDGAHLADAGADLVATTMIPILRQLLAHSVAPSTPSNAH